MTCSRCGLPAVVTLAAGGMQEPLCARCVERQVGLAGLGALANAMAGEAKMLDACPHCGTTREGALRSGLAGCPLCYVVLSDVWPSLGAVPGRYAEGRGETY